MTPSGRAPVRKAFRMSLHAGQESEYIRRHQPIWQDLERTLLESVGPTCRLLTAD